MALNWLRARAERLLYASKQLKNAGLNDFHRAGTAEYRSTALSVIDHVHRNYYWTPPLQRIRPSLEFIERLEDLQRDARYDPFSFQGEGAQLRELAWSIICEAYTPAELSALAVERDTLFTPTPFSALHGRVDFFLEEPRSKRALAVLVAERQPQFKHETGFFTIGAEAAVCFLEHYCSSYEAKPLHVITTNGHQWQLWHLGAEYRLRKTRLVGSPDFRLFEDVDALQAVLGMVRYPLLRFENEELLDTILDMNDQAQR